MKTTIYKTGTNLTASAFGLGKLIINYPEGTTDITNTIRVSRKKVNDTLMTFRMKVYNGHLWYTGGDSLDPESMPFEEKYTVSGAAVMTTDDDGNVIRTYTLTGGIGDTIDNGTNNYRIFQIGAGVTRVEILDFDNLKYAGIYGSFSSPFPDGEINVEQYAYLPTTEINNCYAEKAYGNVVAFKNRTDITSVYFSGCKSVYGDISSFAASAANLDGVFVFRTSVHGSLNKLLDALTAAGVKNKTFTATIGESNVTFNGSLAPSGTLTIDFDSNGDYTLRS